MCKNAAGMTVEVSDNCRIAELPATIDVIRWSCISDMKYAEIICDNFQCEMFAYFSWWNV